MTTIYLAQSWAEVRVLFRRSVYDQLCNVDGNVHGEHTQIVRTYIRLLFFHDLSVFLLFSGTLTFARQWRSLEISVSFHLSRTRE